MAAERIPVSDLKVGDWVVVGYESAEQVVKVGMGPLNFLARAETASAILYGMVDRVSGAPPTEG
jgi:hypothetical protein